MDEKGYQQKIERLNTIIDELIHHLELRYSDAVANGEFEETELNDYEEMARELSLIGVITLGR